MNVNLMLPESQETRSSASRRVEGGGVYQIRVPIWGRERKVSGSPHTDPRAFYRSWPPAPGYDDRIHVHSPVCTVGRLVDVALPTNSSHSSPGLTCHHPSSTIPFSIYSTLTPPYPNLQLPQISPTPPVHQLCSYRSYPACQTKTQPALARPHLHDLVDANSALHQHHRFVDNHM